MSFLMMGKVVMTGCKLGNLANLTLAIIKRQLKSLEDCTD